MSGALAAVAALSLAVAPAVAQSPPSKVTVQAGDTLSDIAVRYYGSAGAASTIAAANGLTDPDRILVGALLNLPASATVPSAGTSSGSVATATPARKVTVKSGESLSVIAEREYGSPAYTAPLAAANKLTDPDRITVGMELSLPAGLSAPTNAYTTSGGAGGRRICIDGGHCGNDPGASFVFDSDKTLRESDVTLDMSLALAARLRAQGFAVTLTRQADDTVELTERAVRCNLSGADLTVSVHLNGVDDRTVNGSLALWGKPAERGVAEVFAGTMQNGLFGPRRGDVTAFGARPFPGRVLLYTKMPAVLVEPVFITNPSEARLLVSPASDPSSRRAQIVREIERGVVSYMR
jgi:N-acetylmuramoyl-L-alanine amidase